MATRPTDRRRGNDLLYKARPDADAFDYYTGPFGSDMRSSIQGPHPENRDDPGGDGPVNVTPVKGRGKGRG